MRLTFGLLSPRGLNGAERFRIYQIYLSLAKTRIWQLFVAKTILSALQGRTDGIEAEMFLGCYMREKYELASGRRWG